MKQLCIFLSILFLLFSCATKQKTKDVTVKEIKTEKLSKTDSILDIETKLSKVETVEDYNQFENVFNAFSIEYNGDQKNELKILIKKKNNETELNIKGKGKILLNENKIKTENTHYYNSFLAVDSIHKSKSEQHEIKKKESLINSVQKKTEKSTKGLQFGVYLFIFGLIIFILLVYISIRYFKSFKR
ncbi:hypothetical protein [Empedobacter tilapiae]|uniref:Lipoprotein n=1 Tax=Empedobacter tilapiae TaxID=2491114 RepID=A0A4Z1BDK9_9FLAO|nr:hypothetical protein [Empedobacter tilapiae]TGN26764.1 hypothetical protein E4J94_09975 [Empedobacter tilapiae]